MNKRNIFLDLIYIIKKIIELSLLHICFRWSLNEKESKTGSYVSMGIHEENLSIFTSFKEICRANLVIYETSYEPTLYLTLDGGR